MIINFTSQNKIRLDDFLRHNLPEKLKNPDLASNSKIRRLIVCGAVFVNGNQICRPAFELRGKSCVTVEFNEKKFLYEKQPDDIKFEVEADSVLYEDDYLIIVNKPSFFPTEETIVGAEKRDNLHDAVVRYLWKKNPSLRNPPYVGIMHRLDRETSGAILFTKQRSVNFQVQKMFETHAFTKKYEAVCVGIKKMEVDFSWTVEKYMRRVSPKSQAAKWGIVSQNDGGLYSKTDFRVLDKISLKDNNDEILCYIIEANLWTGRTHQIRVHLSSYGLPILGDEIYGGRSFRRIMLHSKKLEFNHPVNGDFISIEAPIKW